jgi:hypothetical protein
LGEGARPACRLPIVTARRLVEKLKVTYAAANSGIALLAEPGILEERTGHRLNRIFVAKEALRIYSRPFGEEPELPGTERLRKTGRLSLRQHG